MDKITTDTLDITIAKAKEEMAPESVEAINAVSWKLILQGIAKKYTPEQIETLETETELLLCGLLTTEDYPKELEKRMMLHKAEVALIIDEIDKLIFKKIQDELEKRLSQPRKEVPKPKSVIIDPHFISLPDSTQRAISLSDWKKRIYEIAQKYKINIEQTGKLEEITANTLLGIIHTDQYENEVKSKIGLPEDKNKEMVKELNESVFKKIKELMKDAITNYGVGIRNAKIPLPPYIASNKQNIIDSKLEEKNKQELVNSKFEPIITKNINTPEVIPPVTSKEELNYVDPYREHGIEIIETSETYEYNPVDMDTESRIKKENYTEQKESTPPNEIKNPTPSPNLEIIKNLVASSAANRENGMKPLVNVMAEKLMKKTVNSNTTTDYSLPKMNSVSHDPYHEEV